MKNAGVTRLLPLLALIVCLFWLGQATAAQQPANPDPGATTQQPAPQQDAQNAAPEAQTFTGKIVRSGSKFMLKDSSTKKTYQLDDQDKAKEFEGKDVKVTGTLDAGTGTIRVTAIQPVA